MVKLIIIGCKNTFYWNFIKQQRKCVVTGPSKWLKILYWLRGELLNKIHWQEILEIWFIIWHKKVIHKVSSSGPVSGAMLTFYLIKFIYHNTLLHLESEWHNSGLIISSRDAINMEEYRDREKNNEMLTTRGDVKFFARLQYVSGTPMWPRCSARVGADF